MRLGMLYDHIRGDEKLLMASAKRLKIDLVPLNLLEQVLDPARKKWEMDVLLERCVSTVKGIEAILYFENLGIPVVNEPKVAQICNDKFLTSLVLQKNQVPTIGFTVTFEEEQTKQAAQLLGGYPVVIKPISGSWGRMISKIENDLMLESILEHKRMLSSPQHQVFYLQKYIEKKGRDIRAFVIDHQTICAIYRQSEHWITNTARGGKAVNCPVGTELFNLCRKASRAIGGGVLAMDVFETEVGLKINEVNHTMEFKNSEVPTGVSISAEILKYCLKLFSRTRRK